MASSSTTPSYQPLPVREALTYDDVLIVPRHSAVSSRSQIHLTTKLTRNISLNLPIVSSNMDTVTEAEMAIAMARSGGIGIIHRFLSIEDQANMVLKVKRADNYVVRAPYTIRPSATEKALLEMMANLGIGSILVTDEANKLLGIVTTRDVRFPKKDPESRLVSEIMTPRAKLVTGRPELTIPEAMEIIDQHRVEKLPLVDSHDQLMGLITSRDILQILHRPNRSIDKEGRLLVGAAIGVKEGAVERAEALVRAGVDVLVVDIAHGDSDLGCETTRLVKARFPNVDLIAGNVATGDGVRALVEAGADGIKVGVGGGSICITRTQTGAGVPQLQAVWDCYQAAKHFNVPLIADGGLRTSGDITKALAAGGSTVMLGNMLAGTDEAPGRAFMKDGRKVKIIRGMAGYGSNMSKAEREGTKDIPFEFVPEGVEGVVPARGPVSGILSQLAGGIRSGISYCGSTTIAEMQQTVQFVRVTGSGIRESGYHDIQKI
eukprot:gnl/Hemi2/494_TR175_c0_g1_i1.p1 gnl/Hemi2/494_TR175_c0_g1~~gnl/Hemi2/494_TR175_c0_g1_i1.p1  ORF type:complete len:528 (-),score=197.15 gnl/Hemi2/494_TR175_c0_g1_i1:216-1685(-)